MRIGEHLRRRRRRRRSSARRSGSARGTGSPASRSGSRGSRRCRRRSGRTTPARARAGSGRAASRTSRRASLTRPPALRKMRPCRRLSPSPRSRDNYIWLVREGRNAVVVDPGDAAPVSRTSSARASRCTAILVTHHHGDHVGGIAALTARHPGAGVRPGARVDSRAHARRRRGRRDHAARQSALELSRARRSGPHGGPRRVRRTLRRRTDRVRRRHAVRRAAAAACSKARRRRCWRRSRSSRRFPATRSSTARTSTRSPTFASRSRSSPAIAALRERQRARAGRSAIAACRRCPSPMDDERATNPFLRAAEPAVVAAAAGARRTAARRRGRDVRDAARVEERVLSGVRGVRPRAGRARLTPAVRRRLPSPHARSAMPAIDRIAPTPRSPSSRSPRCVAACATPRPGAAPPPATAPVAVPDPLPPPPDVRSAVADAAVAQPFPSGRRRARALPPPADDLWVRIRKGFAMPDLDDPLVAKWEQWYASRPDYVARMIDRSRRYLYYIVVEVEERGMPLEIALLPMVESAFNPNALSTSRASGIWQFMPSTGTHYGLKQNFWFDSRRDVVAGDRGRAHLPAEAPRRLRRLAARARRATTGAKATSRGRSRRTRRRACRPTTRASRCRTRRATTCRSCRR